MKQTTPTLKPSPAPTSRFPAIVLLALSLIAGACGASDDAAGGEDSDDGSADGVNPTAGCGGRFTEADAQALIPGIEAENDDRSRFCTFNNPNGDEYIVIAIYDGFDVDRLSAYLDDLLELERDWQPIEEITDAKISDEFPAIDFTVLACPTDDCYTAGVRADGAAREIAIAVGQVLQSRL